MEKFFSDELGERMSPIERLAAAVIQQAVIDSKDGIDKAAKDSSRRLDVYDAESLKNWFATEKASLFCGVFNASAVEMGDSILRTMKEVGV